MTLRKKIKLIEVASEIGAGTRGSGLGIEAIKTASLEANSHYFRQHKISKVSTENHLLFEPDLFTWAHRINGVVKVCNRISDKVSETLKNNELPLVLSGDHSNAAGTVAGIKMAYPDKRLGIVWIDAHADLHTPYTTPSGNVHGMPVAAILGLDHRDSAYRKLSGNTLDYWEAYKNIGNICPKIDAADLVYIGLRDYEEEERKLIKQYGIKVITIESVHNHGAAAIAAQALEYVDVCDLLYISFDVDSQDPTISHGTGTPVPGGLTEQESTNIITNLAASPKTCCFEISEVNPLLDNRNRMGINAFRILEKASIALNQK